MKKVLCIEPLPQGLLDKIQALLKDDIELACVTSFDLPEFARLAADAEALPECSVIHF